MKPIANKRSLVEPTEMTTTHGESIDNENAWHIYVSSVDLLRAIDIVNAGVAEVFPISVVVMDQLFPDPKNARISPIIDTYRDSIDPNMMEFLTPFEVLNSPFRVIAILLQPDPRNDKYVECIVDQKGNKGVMWPIAHALEA